MLNVRSSWSIAILLPKTYHRFDDCCPSALMLGPSYPCQYYCGTGRFPIIFVCPSLRLANMYIFPKLEKPMLSSSAIIFDRVSEYSPSTITETTLFQSEWEGVYSSWLTALVSSR